ncbi:MAG TPA: hypothetical protein VFK69_06765 [Candidatus Eisenbacteria bacterium]|nr:hypothetical protein [Candidatus Eisenbacteria bacterium]
MAAALLLAAIAGAAHGSPWRQTQFMVGGFGSTSFGDPAVFRRLDQAGLDLVVPAPVGGYEGSQRERALAARTLLKLQGPRFHLRMLGYGVDSVAVLDSLLRYPTSRELWVWDEPSAAQTPLAAERVARVSRSRASPPLALANLFPAYAFPTDKATAYPDYVESFLSRFGAEPAPVVSVDHYMFEPPVPRDDFYFTLRVVRDAVARHAASARRTPVWVWIQLARNASAPANPTPTLGQIRFAAYTALAYGAKGIFYWTVSPVDFGAGGNYRDGLLSATGDTTTAPPGRYSAIRALNRELHALGRTLLALESVAVMHEDTLAQVLVGDELPGGAAAPRTVLGERGHNRWCMVGELRASARARTRYLLVVNQNTEAPQSFTIDLAARAQAVDRIGRSDGVARRVGAGLRAIVVRHLPAGTGELYRVTWSARAR